MRFRDAIIPLIGLAALLAQACGADRVPIAQLIQAMFRYTSEHPNDADCWYTLGRLHGIAFGQPKQLAPVEIRQRDPIPRFPPSASVCEPHRPHDDDLTKPVVSHLELSIQYYRQATKLAPRNPLSFLAMGWMLEQGHALRTQLGPPPGDYGQMPLKSTWQAESLKAYRAAYALSAESDRRKPSVNTGRGDDAISVESGEGILRLLGKSPAERKEAAAIREQLKLMAAKPHIRS